MTKMDWKTASSHYAGRLRDALNVSRHAVYLAMLPQAEVPTKLKDALLQESESTRRQLDRLEKREFRIAVVGLEKAGKSTFINAWLECDLLPAKGGRCTFTTTQIYSVENESEQKLEVQAKTEEQFMKLLSELETQKAVEDLKTIHDNETTLRQVRSQGKYVFPFTRLDDIREPLNQYVADEKFAHSVLEAKLYTNKLAQAEGIVFYDVPGLDSGLAKHVDEAQEMLSDCDAVILVQRFTSLREKELEIIKFTETGDKNVNVADKLFVFLSRIDSLGSAEALDIHIKEACEDWAKRANLPKERIIHGSAGAYLILNNLARQKTQSEIGSANEIRNKLQSLTHISDENALNQEATGIPTIKNKIFDYINSERVKVLSKRCETSISKILGSSDEIYQLVSKHYSENPEEAKRVEDDNRQMQFAEWWGGTKEKIGKWETIKADLQKFYDSSIMNDSLISASASGSQRLKERYLQVVTHEMQKLREKILSKRDTIFKANSNPVFDPVNANYRWRESLYIDVSDVLAAIASQLAIELQAESLKLVEYMTEMLWGSKQVKQRLIKDSDGYRELLENSLKVLFLRFARPVAEVLIRGPVKSDTREKIIKNLGVDIEIVDNYYSGDESAFKVLKRYAKYGSDLLFAPELRQQILGVTGIAGQVAGVATQVVIDTVNDLKSPQEIVIFEVENDINALEEYLRSAIFDAAGFESYCFQELKNLVDNFREKHSNWTEVARKEFREGNPSLLSELPNNLKSQKSNLEVSERLHQLSVALKKAQTGV